MTNKITSGEYKVSGDDDNGANARKRKNQIQLNYLINAYNARARTAKNCVLYLSPLRCAHVY